jgi:hypothetical protein
MRFFGSKRYRTLSAAQDSIDNFVTAGGKRRLGTVRYVFVFKLLVIH